MAKTMTDLVTRVLLRLSETDLTVAPSAEDGNLVRETYQNLLPGLMNDGLATWPENAIPELYFLAVVDYVAGYLAIDYGASGENVPSMEKAEQRLRELVSRPYTGAVLQSGYF